MQTVKLPNLQDEREGAYLKGSVEIFGVPFHVEAVEVVEAGGCWTAVKEIYQEWVEDLERLCSTPPRAVKINGRDYLSAITPYAK